MLVRAFHDERRKLHRRLFDEGGAEDGREFHRPGRGHQGMDRPAQRQEGEDAVLRRHHVPPRDRRLHDPGRRSARPGHRRPRLQLRGRVPSEAAPHKAGILSMANRGRTPTAASSSSRSRRRRGSTTSTACSAKSSKGWTSSRRSAARRRASLATGRSSRSRFSRSR